MKSISVLTGVRFQPEHFLQHMKKSKKFSYIDFSYVDTLYSPCWGVPAAGGHPGDKVRQAATRAITRALRSRR